MANAVTKLPKLDAQWYTAKELKDLWNCRSLDAVYPRISSLRKQGISIKDRVRNGGYAKEYLVPSSIKAVRRIAPAKKAKVPTKRKPDTKVKAPATELDKLIAAASAVGTENEVLKRKLDAIRKILEE